MMANSMLRPTIFAVLYTILLSHFSVAVAEKGKDLSSVEANKPAVNEPSKRETTSHPQTQRSNFPWTQSGDTVLLDGKPFVENGVGLLVDKVFYAGQDALTKANELFRSGAIVDAIPCRLLDEVDCTTTSHDFKENSPSQVMELSRGKKFRVTGKPSAVEGETAFIYGSKRKPLPSFSYRLRTEARPAPHLLVVESINDIERNLEVAIDPAPGSHPSQASGTLLSQNSLAVIGTGGKFPTDGKPFRQTFLFYPSSDAVTITISASGRERWAPLQEVGNSGSAVARMEVYEIARPLNELANPIEPPAKPRHLALFYPEVMLSFREYGFNDQTAEQRRASVRSMFDYLHFLGFDRFETHPYPFQRKAHFRSAVYDRVGDYDVFDDILPIAEQSGISVVPRIDSLCFYSDMWKNEPLNMQLTKNGKGVAFCDFGTVPDPLRPPVQKLLLDMLGDMLERCKGYKCVPGVGFRANAKFGVLYVGSNPKMLPQESGYSRWDVDQFEQDTGVKVLAAHDAPLACYEWLRANAWEKWIDWRCNKMRQWWLAARDLTRREGKELFVRTVVPYGYDFSVDQGRKLSPLTVSRYHGFDPTLFHNDQGLLISGASLMGIDRYEYKAADHNQIVWHDPRLDGLVRTADGAEVELYYIYWELPSHPCGFRVGPSHMAGRAAFEPLTYALRTRNAFGIIFYNWYRATTGIDLELREFARAYRGLSAVEPRSFDGTCQPAPDDRLWIRWFDERLAVVNDSPQPRTVELTIPHRDATEIFDLATYGNIAQRSNTAAPFRCKLDLRPYDLRTLVFR